MYNQYIYKIYTVYDTGCRGGDEGERTGIESILLIFTVFYFTHIHNFAGWLVWESYWGWLFVQYIRVSTSEKKSCIFTALDCFHIAQVVSPDPINVISRTNVCQC